jgi:acetoin:2,6-dichlorophenolindophenol oxidoreductase subunit beta
MNTTYGDAILLAHRHLLRHDPSVFVFGQGLWSPWYVGGTMTGLDKEFGRDRILDSPVSENATTGAAIGAAMSGMRPIVVHPRMDFMLLAVDPIVNQAANWSYLFNGQVPVPVCIRSIINRGGEQGAQHSQALQALYAHIPGLKVVMPGTATDAFQLLVDAVYDGNPVIYIDDRWCYHHTGEMPADPKPQPIGRGAVLRPGRDLTIVAWSVMVGEALIAAELLAAEGIDVEVIDLRAIKPWDRDLVASSVRRTRRAVVAEAAWATGGFSAEVASAIAADAFDELDAAVLRVTLPDCPAPSARTLEASYYPKAITLVAAARRACGHPQPAELRRASDALPGWIC